MRELFLKDLPVDLVTVVDKIQNRNTFDDIGGLEYLTELSMFMPTTANCKHYISIVKEKSVRRKLIKASNQISQTAYEEEFDNIIDLQNTAMQKLDVIQDDSINKKTDMQSIMINVFDDIHNGYSAEYEEKLYTGFKDLDRTTAGLHKQEVTIIAARPGVGKTALALQLLLSLAKKGNHGLFISREMSTLQLGKRILSNKSGIDGQKLRFCKSLLEDDFKKMARYLSDISNLPIEINDSLQTIQEIKAHCRQLKNKKKLDILFIDYIGLLKTLKRCDSRRAEIEDISRQCKEISLEFDIPVVVLSQLNRENERDKREPRLIDLRESGSIEQDADNVLFLHVPADTDQQQDCFDIKIIVAKQRNGPTGYVYLKYYRKVFRFYGRD